MSLVILAALTVCSKGDLVSKAGECWFQIEVETILTSKFNSSANHNVQIDFDIEIDIETYNKLNQGLEPRFFSTAGALVVITVSRGIQATPSTFHTSYLSFFYTGKIIGE